MKEKKKSFAIWSDQAQGQFFYNKGRFLTNAKEENSICGTDFFLKNQDKM